MVLPGQVIHVQDNRVSNPLLAAVSGLSVPALLLVRHFHDHHGAHAPPGVLAEHVILVRHSLRLVSPDSAKAVLLQGARAPIGSGLGVVSRAAEELSYASTNDLTAGLGQQPQSVGSECIQKLLTVIVSVCGVRPDPYSPPVERISQPNPLMPRVVVAARSGVAVPGRL